jgi:hypothetical protein
MSKFIGFAGAVAVAAPLALIALPSQAAPIPAGWTCTGNCGTLGADGDVTAPPTGETYQYVSTFGGTLGAGRLGDAGGYNGSSLLSPLFTAAANDVLKFNFNYVTTDGSGYSDYAWARLLDGDGDQVAILFTARTRPDGSIVPGFGLPDAEATLTPGSVEIIDGAPEWSPLGEDPDTCFQGSGNGCGYTGWVESLFTILDAGTYQLEFGVTNISDDSFNSGLAINGAVIGDEVIGEVPEPGTLAVLGLGLLGLGFARRRKADSFVSNGTGGRHPMAAGFFLYA